MNKDKLTAYDNFIISKNKSVPELDEIDCIFDTEEETPKFTASYAKYLKEQLRRTQPSDEKVLTQEEFECRDTEEDKKINEYLAVQLRSDKANRVYLPQEYKVKDAEKLPNEDWAQKVHEHDMEMLNACDMVIAVVRGGKASDDGTAFEIGYAAALGKRIWIYADEREPISLMFLNENIRIFQSGALFDEILGKDSLRYT